MGTGTALALTGASLDLALSNKDRLDLLKTSLCKDLTDWEFEHFVEVCNRRRLDPFCRQIYAVKYKGKVAHQTGIDGFRVLAQRSGDYEGQAGPFWCGKDGVWHDAWLEVAPPVAAKVGAYRKGFREPCWAVARFESYNQGQGQWPKMPDVMLAKCAEALALRKAFPEDLSGLYSEDEIAEPYVTGPAGVVAPVGAVVAQVQQPKPVRMAATKDLDAELLEEDAKPRSRDDLSAELAATFRSMMTREERKSARERWEAERANLEPALVASLQKIWDDRIAALVELGKQTKAAPVTPPSPAPEGVTYNQSWKDAEAAERAAIQAADEIPFR